MISRPIAPLRGCCTVPGDKSISHRALMLGASAIGETTVHGLLEAEDVLATADALRALGASIERRGEGWVIQGQGVGGLREPDRVLDLGNSGTGVRLLTGLVASHPFRTFFTGDESLRRRPMRRIIDPLQRMGATFWTRSGDRLPLAVEGSAALLPMSYTLPMASAQVKSAILLAALNTSGVTTVTEPYPSRDHTERLLCHFGAALTAEELPTGGRRVTLTGQPELNGCRIDVPADISSAAFPLVAATLVPGSSIRIAGVGLNPLRTGLITTLVEMGADIRVENEREANGEPVADLTVAAASLRGTVVPAARVPAMIDEFPILAAAAACASGVTRMEGLGELRVKESDRLAAVADGLHACGVNVETGDDWLAVTGNGTPPAGGNSVTVHFDHRIAMAFLVLGIAAQAPIAIDDASAIATSFPDFVPLMNGLGAQIAAL